MQTILICAMGLCINKNKKVLLTKRNDPKDSLVHGKWQIPGGGVEKDELVMETVLREVKEETGYTVKLISTRPAIAWGQTQEEHGKKYRILLVAYPCRIIRKIRDKYNSETMEMGWFKVSDIPWENTLSGNNEIIKELTKSL